MSRRAWWGAALASVVLIAACAEDEGGPSCIEETIAAPDSIVRAIGGAECFIAGTDSAWLVTWRIAAWANTGYVFRAFRIDSGVATPWGGTLGLFRRPPGGGEPVQVASQWGTFGPDDDRMEILHLTEGAEELLVRVLVPRTEDAGQIALVTSRCVPVPITPPDTLPVVELGAGCVSRSFRPGRVDRVTFIPLEAPAAANGFVHVVTERTAGGYLIPAVAGPGADLGCNVGDCLHHYYPVFNGTLGHSIVGPVAGRYVYLLGTNADSAGLARVSMVIEQPPTP